jgi:predicted MFS family arabinose efflux permease
VGVPLVPISATTVPEDEAAAGQPDETGRASGELRRVAMLICAGVFVTTAITDKQLLKLPLRSFVKNELALDPKAMAFFFFVAGFAWYLKPVAGILTDNIPLFGTRRRSYLLVSAVLGALCLLALSVAPLTYHTLLVAVTVSNVMVMFGSTVIGGLIVDSGKRLSATGRLSSLRMVMQNGASLVAMPIGGLLVADRFRAAPAAGAATLLLLAVAGAFLLRETRRKTAGRTVWRETGNQIRTVAVSWPLLATVGLTFLHYVAPGFSSLLYYHQQNALGMSDRQIGVVEMVGGISAVLGALTYARVCRRFNIRALLTGGMLLNATAILFYYGYRSVGAAYCVEAAAGVVAMLGLLPLYDLSARATPRGSEALGYSLIMAIGNFAIGLSDVFGTYLAETFRLKFFDMIWINFATSAAILIFIPLLPKALLSQREGAPAPA